MLTKYHLNSASSTAARAIPKVEVAGTGAAEQLNDAEKHRIAVLEGDDVLVEEKRRSAKEIPQSNVY